MTQLTLAISLLGVIFQKNSVTHMHGLAVYMKEGFSFFAQDLSLEKTTDFNIFFRLALLHSVLTSFSSVNHLLCLYAWFLMLFHVV